MGRYSGHYEYISQLQFASTDVHCQLVETQGKSFIKNSSPSVSENVCPVPLVNEQVCVQLLTSAVFVALPALLLCAVLPPRAATAPAVQQSIDVSYPPGPQQQTRRTLLQRSDETEGQTVEQNRQTDGRTPYRYADPALHIIGLQVVPTNSRVPGAVHVHTHTRLMALCPGLPG